MIRRLRSMLTQRLRADADLLVLWLLLLVAQPLVPVDNLLARADLAPWLMLTTALAAFLRARRYGPGPHPMLTPRTSSDGALMRRLAQAVAPMAVLGWFDFGSSADILGLAMGAGGAVAIIVLLAMAKRHGQTAWDPTGSPGAVGWILGMPALIVSTIFVGWLGGHLKVGVVEWFSLSVALGIAFLLVGILGGRAQNMRQRHRAGRRDGSRYRLDVFPFILALMGPGVGLFVLLVLFQFFGGLDYNQAYVVALFVIVWASVVWPRREPLARACMWHEVIPTGGGDKKVSTSARSFDEPPDGALRFNPLRTKRTRVVHPWLVPVRGSRIAELDDPVRPLWPRRAPFLPLHVLGDYAYEPDPVTKATQSEVLTVRIRNAEGDGVQATNQDGGQTQRLVVLRAFPAAGTSRRKRAATYRWEEGVPAQTVQLLDGTTEVASLRDGDILVVSSEGVARAYELEMGALLYTHLDVDAFRVPQLEDYVKAG